MPNGKQEGGVKTGSAVSQPTEAPKMKMLPPVW